MTAEMLKKALAISVAVFIGFGMYACGGKKAVEPASPNMPQSSINDQTAFRQTEPAKEYAADTHKNETRDIQPSEGTHNPGGEEKKLAPDSGRAASVTLEKSNESEKLYEQGFELYLSGNYDGAIKLFDKAIEADLGCYKAYNGKGIALCFKGGYEEGMSLIRKALEIKPDFAYANFNMAMAYKLKKDYDQAIAWFEKAISFDPDDAWSYYGISTIYADRNDVQKALEYLKKAVSLDPGVKDAAMRQSHFDSMRNNPEFVSVVKSY